MDISDVPCDCHIQFVFKLGGSLEQGVGFGVSEGDSFSFFRWESG